MYLTNLTLPDDARDTVTINDPIYIESELRKLRDSAFFVISRWDSEAFLEEVPLESNALAFKVYTINTAALARVLFSESDSQYTFHGYFYKHGELWYCAIAVSDADTKHLMRKYFDAVDC